MKATDWHHLHTHLVQAWVRDFSPGHDVLTAGEILDRIRNDLDRHPLMAQALVAIRTPRGLTTALMRMAEASTGEPVRIQAVGRPGSGRAMKWRLVRGAGPAVVRRA